MSGLPADGHVAATVRTWDAATGGTAFLDDGSVVPLPATCLQDSVFRFLRPGQRVRLTVVESAVVTVSLPS